MAWHHQLGEQLLEIPDGGVTGGLLCGIGGFGLLLTCASPVLLAVCGAVLAAAAIGVVIAKRPRCRQDEESAESWEAAATRIGDYFEALEAVPERQPGRFQAMLLSEERPSQCRLH